MLQVVVFDLDGVLWDSSGVHARAFAQAFREMGVKLPKSAYRKIAGMGTEEAIMQLLETFVRKPIRECAKPAQMAKRKRELAASWLEVRATVDPEVVPALRLLRQHGFKTALATSASRSTMEVFLSSLPPARWFDTTLCSADVPLAKPAPDLFLAAAAHLDAPPSSCVVVEDSLAGLQAANAAGMPVIAYRLNVTGRDAHVLARCDRLSEVAIYVISSRRASLLASGQESYSCSDT